VGSVSKRAKSEYAQKLLDPRWQKKRLEVLKRDGWACRNCGDTATTLHVHHTYYERGREPWEYPDRFLQTLCANCHGSERELRNEAEAELLRVTRVLFTPGDVHGLAGALAVAFELGPDDPQCEVLEKMLRSIAQPDDRLLRAARYWQVLCAERLGKAAEP
jgi:hypothetical protein